jgi:hypothetical protein
MLASFAGGDVAHEFLVAADRLLDELTFCGLFRFSALFVRLLHG